jgi:hypothetical protein
VIPALKFEADVVKSNVVHGVLRELLREGYVDPEEVGWRRGHEGRQNAHFTYAHRRLLTVP